jgi:hypothetical protein
VRNYAPDSWRKQGIWVWGTRKYALGRNNLVDSAEIESICSAIKF